MIRKVKTMTPKSDRDFKKPYVIHRKSFSPEAIDQFLAIPPSTFNDDGRVPYTNPSVESSGDVYDFYASLFSNYNVWNLSVRGIFDLIVLLRYASDREGRMHVDYEPHRDKGPLYKLTAVTLLCRDSNSEAGLFINQDEKPIDSIIDPGDTVIFPSYSLHQVRGVKSNLQRCVMVAWASGPAFR